ncbi:hypothetical protein PENTCL1PPCAC_23327, partial [Pristionchus entomophagus]
IQVAQPLSDMGFMWKTGKILLRVGLVAGAIKISLDNDIWSLRTEKGSDLYEKLKKYIVPGTIVYREKLPSVGDVQTEVGGRWNNGVNKVFSAVENAPSSLNTVANGLINNKN